MKRRLLDFPLGSVIGIPIDKANVALAVLMRRQEKARGPRASFFAIIGEPMRRSRLQSETRLALRYDNARSFIYASDVLIREGELPLLGTVQEFSLDEWFIPPQAPRFDGDTDQDHLDCGLLVGLIHDDCCKSSKYKGSKWITLEEHKALPFETGIGDGGLLRAAALSILDKKEKSDYWCRPTPARIKRWRWLREQILAEDKKRSGAVSK